MRVNDIVFRSVCCQECLSGLPRGVFDLCSQQPVPPNPYVAGTDRLVYYETIKQELNKRLLCDCRCDERRKTKDERSTRLVYTVFRGGLEHLKIQTRSIDEKFPSTLKHFFPLFKRDSFFLYGRTKSNSETYCPYSLFENTLFLVVSV